MSYVRPPLREINVNTQFFDGITGSVDLRAAYRLARSAVSLAPHFEEYGHTLVWVHGGQCGLTQLAASSGQHCVAGRHTMCDRVLDGDAFVSLRHLLIRSVARPQGGVALRVLDLHTGTGFVLPDGSRQVSVFAEGSVAIGLGSHALIAFPSGGASPPELPEPHLVESDRAPAGPYRAPGRRDEGPLRDLRVSRITLLPRPVMVGESMPPNVRRLLGGRHTVRLARGRYEATVTVSTEDLERGVLIGRSEKCISEALRRITAIGTSRVHVLLTVEDDEVVAYDLASTQGTWTPAGPVRRELLGSEGTVVLGTDPDAVHLYFRRG